MAYTTAQLLGALLTVDGRATEGGILELPPGARLLLDVLVEGVEEGSLLDELAAAVAEAQAARDGAVALVGPVDATVEALVKNTGGIGPLTSGALSATFAAREFAARKSVNLVDYGAKFDRRPVSLSTTAASTALTGTGFAAADVGKVVFVPGAGPTGTPYYGALVANIASVTNSTTAVLTGNATASVAGAAGFIGTNNDSAWQAAFDDLADGGGTINLPAGDGLHAVQKTPPSNVRIVGAGRDITTIHPVGSVNGFHFIGNADNTLDNTHFADFTIDGDMQTNGDGAGAKGFGLYFMVGCTWTDVTVRNTAGSGFGNDTHADCWYVRCIAEGNGRVGTTGSPGHSGFGFGMGGFAVENVYLIDCVARDNMRHGCFLEFQPSDSPDPLRQPAGAQIIGGRFEGNGLTGISDQNVTGLIVLGAHLVDNLGQGFSVTTTAAVDNIAVDGLVANCVITGNTLDGIDLAWTHPNTLPSYGKYRILNNLVASNGGQGIQVRAATGRTLDMIEVRGNTCRANYRNGIRLGGGTFVRSRVTDNTCIDNGQGSDTAGAGLSGPDRGGISVQTVWTDSEIARNYCTDSRAGAARSQAYGILINASGNVGTVTGNSRIVGNSLHGHPTASLGGLTQVSGTAVVRDNDGLAAGTIAGVSSPTSGGVYTCGVRPEQHFIAGGTVTQVAVNGVNLLASGSVSGITEMVLRPADTLTVTWSSAPAWKFRTL